MWGPNRPVKGLPACAGLHLDPSKRGSVATAGQAPPADRMASMAATLAPLARASALSFWTAAHERPPVCAFTCVRATLPGRSSIAVRMLARRARADTRWTCRWERA